jgi:Rad/Gem-related GTP binding protein 1
MPNGYMVVFAVDDSDSLVEAERTLIYLKSENILGNQAVILVANKTDLVRSRVISTNGKKIC